MFSFWTEDCNCDEGLQYEFDSCENVHWNLLEKAFSVEEESYPILRRELNRSLLKGGTIVKEQIEMNMCEQSTIICVLKVTRPHILYLSKLRL